MSIRGCCSHGNEKKKCIYCIGIDTYRLRSSCAACVDASIHKSQKRFCYCSTCQLKPHRYDNIVAGMKKDRSSYSSSEA